MAWTQTVAPTTEPLTLEAAKDQCRCTTADEDGWFIAAIAAARHKTETETGLQLITATWEHTIDWGFPSKILLDRPPLISVSSVEYVDEDGVTQTLATSQYTVSKGRIKHRIVPAYDVTWPTTRRVVDAVTVTFTSGYGTELDVPQVVKQGMKLLIAHWFLMREDSSDVPISRIPHGWQDCVMSEGVLELA